MRKIILLCSVLVCLSACKTEPTIAPKMPQQLITGFFTQGIAGLDTIAGLMQCVNIKMENPFNPLDTPSLTNGYTDASFRNQLWEVAVPADVKLNGTTIVLIGKSNFTYNIPNFGITHRWQITANSSGSVPTIDDSVQSPSAFHVTFPRSLKDTVSKTSGFTCTYGNPGTDSATLMIYYDSVVTLMSDSSIHYPKGLPVYVTVANTGSYYVSSSLLSSLPNSGAIQVWVTARRSKKLTLSGRVYLISSVSGGRVHCNIKNSTN